MGKVRKQKERFALKISISAFFSERKNKNFLLPKFGYFTYFNKQLKKGAFCTFFSWKIYKEFRFVFR